MKPKIDELRLIPAGTHVWSIPLQATVSFKEDMVVKITNTIYGDDKSFFGKIQIILFNIPGCIPGITDKANGEIGPISIDETEPYEMPKSQLIDFKYKDDE